MSLYIKHANNNNYDTLHNTEGGGNQHEISRIASKRVLFTQLSVT